jgi:tetratricopeptide (TPR) repeat protein
MARSSMFIFLTLFITFLPCVAQRSGVPSAPTNRGGTTPGGSPNISSGTIAPSQPNIELIIHVVYPNDHPAGENITVDLQSVTGPTVSTAFTNPEGEVTFHDLRPGDYVLRLHGADVKDASSGTIELNSYESFRTEYVHVEPLESASAVGSTQGSISTADLNIPEKARKEFDKGNEAFAKGDLKKASEHYEKAIGIYPKYAMAYNNLGVAYMRFRDFANARDAWTKALDADPNLASANTNLARVKFLEHNYDQAIPLLQKALATRPDNSETLLLMSEAQLATEHFDQALLYARKVCSAPHEKYEMARIVAGRALEAQSHPDQARVEYEVLIKEAPTSPEASEAQRSLEHLNGVARNQ